MGQGRVYVQLGKHARLDFAKGCEGLAAGNSYVSDGYAHLTRFTVNEASLADGSTALAKPATIRVEADVAFAPAIPKGVPYDTVDSPRNMALIGDTVEMHGHRGDEYTSGVPRRIEVIVNGAVVHSQHVVADGNIHTIEAEIAIDQSTWVAIRQFPQLHSNPINVMIGDQPIRASRRSAQWCIAMTERLWENREGMIAEAERQDAKAAFENALQALAKISDESAR